MAKAWMLVEGRLVESTVAAREAGAAAGPSVMVVGTDRLAERLPGRLGAEVAAQLPHAAMPFVELGDAGAMGIVALPPAGKRGASAARFAFLLSADSLTLMDDGGVCAPVLDGIAASDLLIDSPGDALCALIGELLRAHPEQLSHVRADFETFEQLILEGRERIDRARMMADSRRMLGLDTFYQGLSDVAEALGGSEAAFLARATRMRFASLSRQLDRLSARLESLQGYALQVNGLYQESIDIRQNNVMQWLTVVTTIAMPLTVVTGWFGMNFAHMGLIDASWGYPVVVLLCIVIVALEVIIFRRRGWLRFDGRR